MRRGAPGRLVAPGQACRTSVQDSAGGGR